MFPQSTNPLTRAGLGGQSRHSLAVIGHLAIDTIVHPGFEVSASPGGSAAAVATAAVQGGIATSIFSRIGGDFPGEWLSVLGKLGVDISKVEISEEKKSLRFKVSYGNEGETQKIELSDIVSDSLLLETLPRTECVHLCPLWPDEQIELLGKMKGHADVLSVDFNQFFIKEYEKEDFFFRVPWKAVDILFANEQEAESISGKKDPEEAARAFNEAGVDIAVITLGKKGSIVLVQGHPLRVEAREVEVLDPTGCGDSYIGGFLSEYLNSGNIQKAAGMGTYLASLTAQKKGSWAALMSDVGVKFK